MMVLLDRFAPIGDDEGGALDGDVVVLAPSRLQPAALHQRAVRTDNSDDVLARLEPVAVEYRNVRVGGTDDDVGALGHVAGVVQSDEFRVDELGHSLAKTPAVVRVTA